MASGDDWENRVKVRSCVCKNKHYSEMFIWNVSTYFFHSNYVNAGYFNEKCLTVYCIVYVVYKRDANMKSYVNSSMRLCIDPSNEVS